jgi:hypothetical protein
MNLTVFQSDKGDCLLLTGADGRMVLVDGGMRASYTKHVAPALGKLRDAGQVLDAVYVSHIDQDHISGVLQMMDDEVAWRIHEFQKAGGNATHKPPAAPRPPQVKAIWHNAFREQITKNVGDVEDALAASAAILSGSSLKAVRELASSQSELVTSIAEAIQLSRRVSPEQLGIKLNPPSKGKLMLARSTPGPAFKIGGMQFSIIGPFPADLRALREEWNEWLRNNKERLTSIRQKAERDESAFGASEISALMLPKLQQAESLSSLLPLEAAAASKFKLGDRKKVTTPNLASLMMFLKEGGKTVLLTGDGHWEDILRGLRLTKKLKASGGLHVDVLKVQHHGSEHNVSEEFCRAVTADHYIFCGNGEHENPDLRVIQAIADSRIGTPEQLSPNKQAGNPFKFWFNSSETATEKDAAKAHMKEIAALVRKLAKKSGGRLDSFFLKGASFNLSL